MTVDDCANHLTAMMALMNEGGKHMLQDGLKQQATCQSSRDATLTQVALLQSLLQGDYYGSLTLGELKQRGDTGIGTFNALDGELVMVDGVVYRAKADGTVERPGDEETTPFAVATFLVADRTCQLENVKSFEELESLLGGVAGELGANHPCVVRIDGSFSRIYVRSVPAQKEPYRTLVEALTADQTFCECTDIEGTVVAFYFPPYMRELNNAGWHLHFVSADGSKGGHVLELSINDATVTVDRKERFEMLLPERDEFFNDIDFTKDRSEEVRKAETNK